MIDSGVPDSWLEILTPVLSTTEAQHLEIRLRAEEAAGKRVFPPAGERLRALELTPLSSVKVVILGQDPYHQLGQAHGLSFSVPKGVRVPPSLRNIFKELNDDLKIAPADNGSLDRWAKQGVLLLNNSLTVEEGRPGSHAKLGWDAITDAVVRAVADRSTPSVFILWGNHAQSKASRIPGLLTNDRHLLLKSVHPSPLSAHRGFFGSKPFSKSNAFLATHGRGAIAW